MIARLSRASPGTIASAASVARRRRGSARRSCCTSSGRDRDVGTHARRGTARTRRRRGRQSPTPFPGGGRSSPRGTIHRATYWPSTSSSSGMLVPVASTIHPMGRGSWRRPRVNGVRAVGGCPNVVRAPRTTTRCARRTWPGRLRATGRSGRGGTPAAPPTLDRRQPLAIELEVHRCRNERSDRHEDPLGRVADEQLPRRDCARRLARAAERVLEPEQRADVERGNSRSWLAW